MRVKIFYTMTYSPDDNGYYAEVYDKQGKEIWLSDLHGTRMDVLASLFDRFDGNTYELIELVM
jgi:hypothetical protein